MTDTLETLARIFIRCFIVGFIFVLVWLGAYLCGLTCSLPLFPMTQQECSIMTYAGIGLFKIFNLLFFLIPWIAIKLELRYRKRSR
jgi:hypothetical protein